MDSTALLQNPKGIVKIEKPTLTRNVVGLPIRFGDDDDNGWMTSSSSLHHINPDSYRNRFSSQPTEVRPALQCNILHQALRASKVHPAAKPRRTRYPEVRRFNRCLRCLGRHKLLDINRDQTITLPVIIQNRLFLLVENKVNKKAPTMLDFSPSCARPISRLAVFLQYPFIGVLVLTERM